MDLFEASKQGLPLVVETREGGARLAAEIFPHPIGIVYADTGWPGVTSHPFHILEGKLRETDEGWTVGDTPIRVAFEGEDLHASWQAWQHYRAGEGKGFDRQECWRAIGSAGILLPPP